MSTQVVVPDKLKALLALANAGAPQTTDPAVTRTIAPIPIPQMPVQPMQRLTMPQNPSVFGSDAPKIQQAPMVPLNPPAMANLSSLNQPRPNLPSPGSPNAQLDPQVAATQLRTLGDMGELRRLQTSGSGIQQITHPVDANGNPTGQPVSFLRKLGGDLARIGDTALSIVSPRSAQMVPGTELHHDYLLNQQTGRVNNDLGDEEKQAQTNLLDATPELRQQAAAIQQMRALGYIQHVNDQGQHYDQQSAAILAMHGLKADPQGNIVPQTYAEMSEPLQAMEDLKQSQVELAEANAALKKSQNDPTSPAYKLAEARAATAKSNASAAMQRAQSYYGRYLESAYNRGLDGQTLPGALEDTAGNPVGTSNAANVRPTGQERRVKDLAQSAVNQVHVMRTIVQDHPEIFGPVGGRTLNVEKWLGTQSPDAQAFLSASRYLADHSAGVFGSRSVEITRSLEQLTDPNANPAAINAALDRAEQTAQHFVDEGKVPLVTPKQTATQYKQFATNGVERIGSNDGGKTWFDVKTGKAVQ